ncbi:hypothetical protein J4407_00545 [Candidatus Pacearchaeota archaeon]|nr:hypothetical protein [Candidatus Pacearchaeota archaeon]
MNKRGISIVIGYVLLIAMVLVIGGFVYSWLSTFVPTEQLECSDGVGMYINSYTYNCDTDELVLNLRNNGRFGVAGYYIRGTESQTETLPITDLSEYEETDDFFEGAVLFQGFGDNNLKPNSKIKNTFDFSSAPFSQIYKIQLIPLRSEVINDKKTLLSCTNAEILTEVSCYAVGSNGILSASYSNLCKNCGTQPDFTGTSCSPGADWWYYESTLRETGGSVGLTIEERQKCFVHQNPEDDYCGDIKTDIEGDYGTNEISAGGVINADDFWVCTDQATMTVTETFWGVDDNGKDVEDSYTFTVS